MNRLLTRALLAESHLRTLQQQRELLLVMLAQQSKELDRLQGDLANIVALARAIEEREPERAEGEWWRDGQNPLGEAG